MFFLEKVASSVRQGGASVLFLLLLTGCAQGLVPQPRNVNIPSPQQADGRPDAVNDRPDSVIYLPLGRDVLVPETREVDELPDRQVGPFELRGETLGGALQLILADIDIPIAFQTDLGLTRAVTVTNLKGDVADVVDQVCSLANLYCSFEKGSLVIKETQTFTVVVPPIGEAEARNNMMTSVSSAIQALTGITPVTDVSNRTIIYQATSRTAEQVNRYFQRMRASTSMVIFETYIWEVTLDNKNAAGIQWDHLQSKNKFNFGVSLNGTIDPDAGTPISIGLPTTGTVDFDAGDVLKFISTFGAVKTISQPQLTVLSGSTARLRVADTQNYVSEITRTVSGDQVTVSNETDSVESGFTLQIGSSWDNSTVYGNINIVLNEVRDIQTFDDNPEAIVQLPQTTAREVQTQVRVRPGDSLVIAGLVRETDNMNKEGLGIDKPIIPTSRSTGTSNIELVFLLKPRVVAFVDSNSRYNRTPVESDVPAPMVGLSRHATQSSVSMNNEAVDVIAPSDSSVDDYVAPEMSAAPVPITPSVDEMGSVIGRLFETTPATSPVVPAVDAVTSTQLKPTSSVDQKKPSAKKQTAKKRKKKSVKKATGTTKLSAKTVEAPAAAAVVPAEPMVEAPKVTSDNTEAILNTPDTSAPTPIANDLPALTDGTVLPSSPATVVTP